MEQEETLCDEVETVSELTYLGHMVSAGGGCVAAVTARTRCGWVIHDLHKQILKVDNNLQGDHHSVGVSLNVVMAIVGHLSEPR